MHFPKFTHKSISIALSTFLCSGSIWAQDDVPAEAEAPVAEPPPEPAAEPAPAFTPSEEPAPTGDPPPATPDAEAEMSATEEVPKAEVSEEPLPAIVEDTLGSINWGVWGRVDMLIGNGNELNDVSSAGRFELHTSGSVHKYVNFTANFIATYNPEIAGNAALLDGIIQLDLDDAFHLWGGRMLVPVDRSNFAGPFFMAPWYYPGFGFADGQVGAPRQGPNGRNDGFTAWGYFLDGMIKYYAGAYDLFDVNQSPLYSGRIALSLISPEPGYYSNSTYYGKDILAIGIGGQVKPDGSVGTPPMPDDPAPSDTYSEFNADILFEKKFGDAGILDIEGAVYLFNGEYEPTDASWFALASYLIPTGIGGFQPLVRVQQAIPSADAADTSTLIDAQVNYVVNDFATRFALGYRKGIAGDLETQGIFVGAQFIK